jgi:hypothetical protein
MMPDYRYLVSRGIPWYRAFAIAARTAWLLFQCRKVWAKPYRGTPGNPPGAC